MSSPLATIDPIALDHVVGGGSSSYEAQVGVQVPERVNVGVSGKRSQTDYAKCVSTVAGMPGATPSDLRAACGLPPGADK